MLTLESKYSEFIQLVIQAGACVDESKTTSAPPVMEKKNEELGGTTILEGIKQYLSDDSMPEEWMSFVFTRLGKDLDVEVRKMFLLKVKNPKICVGILTNCFYLSEDEIIYIKSKLDEKILICLTAIEKHRAFNMARVGALETAKSVYEAKAMIELKLDVATTIVSDDSVKSPQDIKEILEAERTKSNLEMNEVLRQNGYIDKDGKGSIEMFYSLSGE